MHLYIFIFFVTEKVAVNALKPLCTCISQEEDEITKTDIRFSRTTQNVKQIGSLDHRDPIKRCPDNRSAHDKRKRRTAVPTSSSLRSEM